METTVANLLKTQADFSPNSVFLSPRKALKKMENADTFKDEHILNPKRLVSSIHVYGEQKELSKCDDLSQITKLEMCIDSEKLFLGNFGEYVPNLRLLKISNGIVPRIRDLGSSLRVLEVMWMPRCCLSNLDGLENFKTLKELYLPFNEISDISACGLLECLEILDLEGNQVEDRRNVSFLSVCKNLSNLTLEGNPIVKQFKSYSKYWAFIKAQLPTLAYLDGLSTKSPGKLNLDYPREYNFEENWAYINSVLAEVGLGSQAPVEDATCESPEASNSEPPKGTISPNLLFRRPVSALHMSSSEKRLRLKVEDDGVIVDNLESSLQNISEIEPLPQIDAGTTSRLTCGGVICGDISKALRKRRSSATPRSPATPSAPSSSASGSRHPPTFSHPTPRTPLESTRSLEEPQGAVAKEVTQVSSFQTPETSPRSATAASSREADDEPVCSVDNELNDSIISTCDTEAESGPILSSIEKLQRDCAEALEELEAWRREFLRTPKKKSVRVICEPSQRNLVGLRAQGDVRSSLAERVRGLIQNDGRPAGSSGSRFNVRKHPTVTDSATTASPLAELESRDESTVQKSEMLRPTFESRDTARVRKDKPVGHTGVVSSTSSASISKSSESSSTEPGASTQNYQSKVPSQRWQANAVRPPVRPENTSASIAALRSRLASQFEPSIANGINAVIDRRTAQQPSPSSSSRRTPVSGKVAHHSALKNLPGGDSNTAAAASSPSPPVPAGPKIRLRNQPTLPSKLCLKQGNT